MPSTELLQAGEKYDEYVTFTLNLINYSCFQVDKNADKVTHSRHLHAILIEEARKGAVEDAIQVST